MPAVSKKQQKYFGYLLSNPEERKKKGITKKAAKDFAQSVDEAIERQAKDRKKLSQPHSVSGSRRDHSHDVDSALTDHVPGKGKGRIRKASKKEMRVSAMRDAGIKEEKDCPAGHYFCFDRGKCMPIPKGKKVRGDGELVNEVSPPGWGHTKAEKEKTKPWKPKSKIGGSADAFKKDLDSGKFKGLPGDKTKKEKTASMFKLMWSMKKKGYKPHYKPGTDEKYEKYKDKDEKNESFVLEREDSPYEKASDKALDKKYGYGTSHDKGPKTGFGRASNRATAAAVLKDIRRRRSKSTSETRADAAHKGWSHTARTSTDQTPEKKATRKKLADTPYKKLPKDEQEKDQVAADAVKKEYDKRKKVNESTMPNVHPKDRKVIRDRAKNLFKKDLKGTVRGVNEDSDDFKDRVSGVLSTLDRHRGPEEKKDLAKKIGNRRKKREELSRLVQHYRDMKSGFAEEVKGQDTESRKEGARERASEKKAHDAWKKRPGTTKRPLYSTTRHTKGDAENYATQQKQSIKWHDQRTKGKFIPGTTTNEGKTWKDFKRTIDTVRGKKQEMPKPKRADDAGARARRALKRKEYQAKVSVIVPPELED